MQSRPLEIWRDIPGYEGLYQASTLGRVRSMERYEQSTVRRRLLPTKVLRPQKKASGYNTLILRKGGMKSKYLLHRLIAFTFLHNPDNLPEINHKNEDKRDNRVENLEWCDKKYNCKYGRRTQRIVEQTAKAVIQLDSNGNILNTYPSTKEAERRTGFSCSHISECCNGLRNQAYGYKWKYAYGREY